MDADPEPSTLNPSVSDRLRRDAMQIWQAGLRSVDSSRLVRQAVAREANRLIICDEPLDLDPVRRIAIVGAGKAGTGMAAGLLEVLGPEIVAEKHVTGWINVPEDCVRSLPPLTLHPARPAGVNEPTEAGAHGAQEILRLVRSLGSDDLCFCLISGGASALLPAPADGIALADKLAVTRQLSAAGANIAELNVVRKQISQIKGGGLTRACQAGRLITLIISDVLGDPLPVVASGPTVEDMSTPDEALAVLERFDSRRLGVPAAIFNYLQRRRRMPSSPPACLVANHIIGNLVTAVDAAGMEAERLGYSHAMTCARQLEGDAEEVGRHLAQLALSMRRGPGPDCLISGGEPVVRLAPSDIRGLGGRNQQLALAALEVLAADGGANIALLSGGTDGEDGPTDAAGAVVDEQIISAARSLGLDPADYLRRSDAYHFFEPLGGLLKTGPTHTNVGDLRVVVVARD